MKDNVFIDTNIWVYAHITDDQTKHALAHDLLEKKLVGKHVIISAQILSEFYAAMTKNKIAHAKVSKNILEIVQTVSISPLKLLNIESALRLKEKYKYSWWDSLILASSLEAECETLYSEDMQNEQVIEDSLVIRNPFILK
jgi:predicted nucleic acid-binding protein